MALLCLATVLGFGDDAFGDDAFGDDAANNGQAIETSIPTTVAPKPGAVLVGSSSMRGTFGKIIAADLERNGYRVTRKGFVSAGLARPDCEEWSKPCPSMRRPPRSSCTWA